MDSLAVTNIIIGEISLAPSKRSGNSRSARTCPRALPVPPCCKGIAGFLHAQQLFLGKYRSVQQQLSQAFFTFRGLAGRLPFKHGLCFPPLGRCQLCQRPQQLFKRYVELDLHAVKITNGLPSSGVPQQSTRTSVDARARVGHQSQMLKGKQLRKAGSIQKSVSTTFCC